MLHHDASLVDFINLSLPDRLTYFYERYSRVEPFVNAFVSEENFQARLMHDADLLSEKFPSHEERPPLFGVPVAIKDLIHVEGFPTRAGSELPSSVLTASEGSMISKLRSLGALFAGKTVTEEFAYHSVTPTRNPHNLAHTPGGSSAGSAASVAAGICSLSVGTQTLRSIIAPASFCGVVGFKPSYQRVALDGVIRLSPSFDTIGFFTQDMDSVQLASSHLLPDWRPFFSDQKPTLGVPNGIYMSFMSDEVRRVFEHQLQSLEKAGYTIRNVDMPWDDAFLAGDAMIRMVQGEMAQLHEAWFKQYEHLYGPSVKAAIQKGQTVPVEELEQYRAGQIKVRMDLEQTKQKNGVDVWVSPSQGGVAPKGFERMGWSGMTAIWSYAGLPTISLPLTKIDGLPVGFQCIGSFGNDEALLFWTKEMEQSFSAR
ncbi:amidase [Brevibacillus reuszeri]|uniref:Amidase n=1 Tax=Brevibacillus reuszeri TaxID=54915 RepID=A0ABQ0TRS7_9BACL|nr:amidase [Brevibacillus reuszeri]MED1860985.1 amidase [Brevibacillus reuszeri]GED70501.1 amidase [Brevibacillus reuszeri]